MTTEEIIKTLKIASAEVEWNYPLDYALAIDEAIEIIEQYNYAVRALAANMEYILKITQKANFVDTGNQKEETNEN